MLSHLNIKQKEAVLATDGPVLIVAGAGSGKTMVLTHKIAYLTLEKGVSLDRILAVTFTNKAASEMKERIFSLLEKWNKDTVGGKGQLTIGTFHSVCLKILRTHTVLAGYETNFVIADTKDQESMLKTILAELSIDEKKFGPELFMYHISKLKNKLITAQQHEEEVSETGMFPELAAKVYVLYQESLKKHNAVDFDDIIMQCVLLLKNNPDVLAYYQDQFQYIFIDEYQDTNHAQYQLAYLLARKHKNICVVGDSDQAIYGWRQADMSNILNFEKDYPNANVFVLEENYRSTQTILHAANMVIKKNKIRKEKNLFTQNELGSKINIVVVTSERQEAKFITEKIRELSRTEHLALSDFAILYRTNAQSRVIEEAFTKDRIPYRMTGGFRFYDRKEIKDILAYLRFIHNDKDKTSLKRIINTPARGIGKASLDKFLFNGTRTKNIDSFFNIISNLRDAYQTVCLSDLVKRVAKDSGIQSEWEHGTAEEMTRWENILELVSASSLYGDKPSAGVMTEFLDNVALVSQEEKTTQRSVNLMTMHSAKGLEFKVVFVVGMEDGIFPHQRSKNSPSEMEEERRLCYVAITRAGAHIYLVYAKARRLYGQMQTNPPSRFLFDIPEQFVSFHEYGQNSHLDELDFKDGIVDIDA